ncbi:MAG: YdcF family protein [Candidatus Pacebacteria bacterium]|nr:YdcF family protein [Candidatus Paceibacterota bacterium]
MNEEDFIKLLAFIANERPERADAIVFIEGDGGSDVKAAVDLYRAKFAPKILITGEIKRGSKSRVLGVFKKMIKLGVPEKNIIMEFNSVSAREQAIEVLKIAKELKWKKIILTAPLYHQPRLYATFIRRMKEVGLNLKIVNCPIRELPWFKKTIHGKRIDLLKTELNKIKKYAKKEHVASLKEITEYERKK